MVNDLIFKDLRLERWLSLESIKCEYNLGGATPPALKLKDLVCEFDLNRPIGYGYTKGSNELREVIAAQYSTLNKEDIVVTHGTAEANFLIISYLLEEGDEMVFLAPTYLGAYGVARAIGANVKSFFLNEEDNYKLDLEKLKEFVTKKTKVIFATNPNNPTATKLSAKDVKSLCELAEDHNSFLVFDEALHGLEIDGVGSPSPVDFYEKGITTRSLSKMGLGGLRIGWVAAHKKIADGCWAIKDYTTLGISGLSEYFATIALKKENYEKILDRNREILRMRLKILYQWIDENQEILSLPPLEAGAAAFPRYNLDLNSLELARRLLAKEKVLVSPGDYFLAPKHFRMNYTWYPTNIDEKSFKAALERIDGFFKRLNK